MKKITIKRTPVGYWLLGYESAGEAVWRAYPRQSQMSRELTRLLAEMNEVAQMTTERGEVYLCI